MSAAQAEFTELTVGGLHCPSCAGKIEEHLKQMRGVTLCQVNFGAARVGIGYDPERITRLQLETALERLGHPVQRSDSERKQSARLTPQRMATGLAGLMLAAGAGTRSAGAPSWLWIGCYALSLASGGAFIARRAWTSLRRTTDINTLMVVAAVGAAAMGDWPEAATVLFLFSIAELLEAYSVNRTRLAVRGLMELAPDVATVSRHGNEETVPVDRVREGETLLIRPGGRVPLDGVVTEGRSAVNEAAITGEAIPKAKGPGDAVYAGTFNEAGRLTVRVTRAAGDTTLARIVSLVEEAQAQRSPTEKLIDRFARYYTPLILGLAVLLAAVPPLLGGDARSWIYRSLTLLIISCPCALVISTPVAMVCGIARAARSGVLIKGGVHLERLAAVKVVAFDKTGTLTHGQPMVTDIVPLDGLEPDTLLALATSAEDGSEHAVGKAVLQAARARGLVWTPGRQFEAVPGAGIRAESGGMPVAVGRPAWVRELGCDLSPAQSKREALEAEGKTVVLVARENAVVGLIAVRDRPREGGEATIRSLRALGVARIAMLTGDQPAAARAVAAAMGIQEYFAELMPAGKVEHVRRLSAESGAVAMVGDGINDAPALAAATVGIAMGAAGTDVALETADVALMGDDLTRLPFLIHLSRRTLSTVRQNVAFAVLVKAAFITLTVAGLSSLWLAVLADTGTTVLVVLNSLRLLHAAGVVHRPGGCCPADH